MSRGWSSGTVSPLLIFNIKYSLDCQDVKAFLGLTAVPPKMSLLAVSTQLYGHAELVTTLKVRQIPLEINPSSNARLKVFKWWQEPDG
jgi:hypothetical protein